MMHADTPTLFLAIVAVSLTLGVGIGFFARGSALRPLQIWSVAMLCYGLGYILLGLRGQIPDLLSVVVANVFQSAALALCAYAIARLTIIGLPGWLLWGPPLLVAVTALVLVDQYRLRGIILIAIFAAQVALIVVLPARYREGKGAGRLLLMMTSGVMSGMLLLRLAAFLFNLSPPEDLLSPGVLQAGTYLFALLALLLTSVGFVFMVKEKADRALSASEEHFRAFFERSMVGMATFGVDRRWIEVNPALCAMLGYTREELLNISWTELTHPDDIGRSVEAFDRVLAGAADEYELDKRYLRKDGSVVATHVASRCLRRADGGIDHFVSLMADISERKAHEDETARRLAEVTALNARLAEAQSQLLQAEKMASIGQLAAGVAHEINNPVGFVKSNLGTLDAYVNDLLRLAAVSRDTAAGRAAAQEIDLDFLQGDVRALLDESREGLERVSKIVRDLRDFARIDASEWETTDIHQCLESTLNIVWNELKYKCTVTRHYGELPLVRCLPSQLGQVFLNLLVNAAQAIETQGEIIIITEAVGDSAVQVSIADNGRGIAAENLQRVFDPFFTTKPVGEGTGLGLSLAWSIVQRHQGSIDVFSEPGRGSRFRVRLPIAGPSRRELDHDSAARIA